MEIYSKFKPVGLLICIPIIGIWYYVTSEYAESAMLALAVYGLLSGYCAGRCFEEKNNAESIMKKGESIPGKVKRIARVYYGNLQKAYVLEVEADSKRYFSCPVSIRFLNRVKEDVTVYIYEDEYFVCAGKSDEKLKRNIHKSVLRVTKYPEPIWVFYVMSICSVILAAIIVALVKFVPVR